MLPPCNATDPVSNITDEAKYNNTQLNDYYNLNYHCKLNENFNEQTGRCESIPGLPQTNSTEEDPIFQFGPHMNINSVNRPELNRTSYYMDKKKKKQ